MIFPNKPQIAHAPMLGTIGGGSLRSFGRGTGGVELLDWTFKFDGTTNASRTGATYSTLNSYYSGLSAPFANDTSLFNVTTNGYQDVVILGGTYEIQVNGGSTGSNALGARITAQFTLDDGALRIICGSKGTNSSGAGGSFVFYSNSGMGGLALTSSFAGSNILVAAGGAGGKDRTQAASDGSTTNVTTTGAGKSSAGGSSAYGQNGSGGTNAYTGWSGGSGAGILSNGSRASEYDGLLGTSPVDYDSGFSGADSGGAYGGGIAGFGGGARGSFSGAGGGGYSGGSGHGSTGDGGTDYGGGGGGSFVKTSSLPSGASYIANSLSAVLNTDTDRMGYVVISPV
tara:strand:- start:46 stop:1071 length:1026 start_codon:yes stop_codon:yes gene_type:complete